VKMKAQIGYFPDYLYIGYFPFEVNGSAKYVFKFGEFSLLEMGEKLIPQWMSQLSAYPIYICTIFSPHVYKLFQEDCNKNGVRITFQQNFNDEIERNVRILNIVEIRNAKQFKNIMIHLVDCSSDLVLWSSYKNAFTIERRSTEYNGETYMLDRVVVRMSEESSVFWIDTDSVSIYTISNDDKFSDFRGICKTLPSFVIPMLTSYY